MEDNIKCPNCGEEENFHFNYDYTKKERPVEDILCNECGTFFNIKKVKKYALTFWDTKTKTMIKGKTIKYITEEEFVKDDWQEKTFDLDKTDFIEE